MAAAELQFYNSLAEQTAKEIVGRPGNWTHFLDTAARLYKYPFPDQLLIYAQKPDATACAEQELWNKKFNRWRRRGVKGIALIDDTGSYPRLKYVFDVADTEASRYNARPIYLWEMRQEHKAAVLAELAKSYEDVGDPSRADNSLADSFRNIAKQLAQEYYNDNAREIWYRAENSMLEPLSALDAGGAPIEEHDDGALEAAFVTALSNSVAYSLMARCGLDTEEYFEDADFQGVIDFNTPDMVYALGTATSDLSEQVLRDIETIVRKYERVKNAERSEESYDRNPYLQPSGRLSAPEHQAERAAAGGGGTAGAVRTDEEAIPQRTPDNNLQPPITLGETVPAPTGDRPSGDGAIGAGDVGTHIADRVARQGVRPDGVDGGDEHVESAGGGNGGARTDLSRLGDPPPLSQVGTRSISEILSTSSISMDEVDSILRDGGNFDNHKLDAMPFHSRSALRIAARFAKGLDDNAEFLKREYLLGQYGRDFSESGKGFKFNNHSVCAWFDENGISLAIGTTARNNMHKVTIPWESAAARVDELMREGRYLSRSAFDNALDNERRELANHLWDFYRDDMGDWPEEWDAGHGHPEDVAKIKALLEDENERQAIFDRLEADIIQFNYDGNRSRWHNPTRLLKEMNAAMHPPIMLPADDYSDTRDFSYFITQDEIDANLTDRASGFSEGKFRVLSFFLNNSDEKERIKFIKGEYGLGGGGTRSEIDGYEDHSPGIGITLRRGGISDAEAEVNLKWNAVVKRIGKLIGDGLYMTRAELDYLQDYERLSLVKGLNNFYSDLPDEYERPFPGKVGFYRNEYLDENGKKTLDFHYPRQAEWQAVNDLLDDTERLDALYERMKYIFDNTPADDRYYDTRKEAFDALTGFREGTYTLFPGIENLPDPETAARRLSEPQFGSPRSGMILNLGDSSSDKPFLGVPTRGEQLSLFDAAMFPKIPSVDEQRATIDRELREEAATEVAASSVLENDIDTLLTDISNEDKARIIEQFSDNPRSREAVNLVKEIYGDSLPIPLPQAIKRIAELVENGQIELKADALDRFEEIRDELERRGFAAAEELIADGINDYYNCGGDGDYHDVVDFIVNEYLTEEPDVLNAAIDEIAASEAEKRTHIYDQRQEAVALSPPGSVVMLQVGSFYEMFGADAGIAQEQLGLELIYRGAEAGFPERTPMCGFPAWVLETNVEKLKNAGYTVAVANIGEDGAVSLDVTTPEPAAEAETPLYKVGDTVYLERGIAYNITAISDSNGDVSLFDPTLSYPVKRIETKEVFESMLSRYPGNERFFAPPEPAEIAEIEPPVELDFDTAAQIIYERVMADKTFAEALGKADMRGKIRDAVLNSLDNVFINAMEQGDPQRLRIYFVDDDLNDRLFDYIYRRAWENRPQAEKAQEPEVAHEPTAESVSEPATPRKSYITGQRVVLDLRENVRGTFEPDIQLHAGEFYVDSVTDDNILVRRGAFSTILTHAEAEQYTVTPIAERVVRDPDTDYYLIHYPEGIDAAAALGEDELRLITQYAKNYTICAEACFLSGEDKERCRITFRKMPRDWNLLPSDAKNAIRAIKPEYEAQWNEMYGDKPQPPANQPPTQNYRITDMALGEGGAKTKFRYNADAIALLHDLEFDGRNPTPEEQEVLSRYVGWGGLAQAFDPDNKQWEDEYLELNALLSPEEWNSAKASTINSFYTTPTIINAMWETIERMGFKSGNILEPSCGIGNFFGMIPQGLWQSKLYGVELDSVTARIAKYLYPKANIQQAGFEKTTFSDAFFDLAIGNVPFGDYGVADKRYDKQHFSIHDYFFAKALDKVRPGGVVAFLTSKFTMDSHNPSVRKYLAQRAELLGAVRLPNNTFLKNAGTETTMDILFLQKRDRVLDIEPDWVHLGVTEDANNPNRGIHVNRYYLDNPEMVLGKMALDERMNNKYGRNDYTCCLPTEGADLAEQLKTALLNVQGTYEVTELDDVEGVDDHAIPADEGVKNFSYALVTPSADENGQLYAAKLGEGQVYFRENSLMYPVDLPATTLDRIRGMIGLRDCVNRLIELQLDEYGDAEIETQQARLNLLYDRFYAEFGLINNQANNRAFRADSAYYLLSSLEILDEDGNLQRKADMFTKRTIKQKAVVTHVDTASEALAVSLGEKARIDLDYMSELTGFDQEKLLEDLRGVIFFNAGSAESQEKIYVTADEYLSGNVREKLRQAEASAKVMPELSVNVEALRAAQPKDLEASEIAVRLGATWIDPQYVQQFMDELLNASYRNRQTYQVKYHAYTGEWQVSNKGRAQYSDVAATVTYGTGRMNAYQILDDTLNLRDVRVYDYKEDADGRERRVLNKKETMLAQQKQETIKQAFKDWIWRDPERRQTLTQKYNEMFNSVRPREYDGSHLVLSGITPEITMQKHQLNAIARQIYGGNTLLAHVVGAGKTFEMIAAAMEMRRLGLCHKSLFAVPNHLTEQWAGEFLRLYPAANILVATKRDFEMRNRKKFCAKIATGDYDAVIIGHTQLEKIPMSRERQERLLQEQLWEIEEGIRELKATHGERFSIKQLEKTKKSVETRLTRLLEAKKRDDVVTFEQLGVDRLFVDESHNFKNLFMYTKMRNVAGLSTTEAQKSSDLFMKCRYMDELTDGKGMIFATGTPISNSMTEMYTVQRYLQYDTLAAKGLTHFDAWASIFGETVTSIELAPEGTGYRARTRFAQFHNLPELMAMFKDVADIQTADMLNLPVPKANFETIVVEPSDLQKEMVQELSERAAAVHDRQVDPSEDNMLKITTDGRKIGLDQRLINPLLPDFEGSKVNACTDKIFGIWGDTRSDRLTQLVFCDFSTPGKGKEIPTKEGADGTFEPDWDAYNAMFSNVYEDIRKKLIQRGIPESEIAFIHDADSEVKKKELFAKVRQGKVRILFGSTFKMGAGTNVRATRSQLKRLRTKSIKIITGLKGA